MKLAINITNRKAKFDYHLEKSEIAGMVLTGSEVKSIRAGKVNMADSFCVIENNEVWIRGLVIQSKGNAFSHQPNRERKLLLRKTEITKIEKSLVKGYSLIPIRIFTTERNLVKIEISLGKGKKNYDKRESIKERDVKRDIDRGE